MKEPLVLYSVRFVTIMVLLAIASLGWGQFKVDQEKIPIVQARRRALVIGASQYQFLGKLNYAAGDARRFRDALVDGFRFSKDSIKFLSDSEDDALKPTSENILESLKSLLSDPILDKGDLFILFFSGHGIGTPRGDYLCATDSKAADVEKTGLPVREVINKLVEAKLRNVVIITDACRAGEKNEFGLELQELAKKANIAVMLGCEPGKKSYEAPQLKSGVFTYFLLKALSNPKTRTESGGLWTSKIAESLSGNVFEYTERSYGENAQRPVGFADPTSDVLLAKYIDNDKASQLVKGADDDLKQLRNPRKLAHELVMACESFFEKNDFVTALELAKQAQSLDAENMFATYYASVATGLLGRSGEHEKFCDSMKQSKDPYFKSLGIVSSDSRATTIDDRAKALRDYWALSPKDELHALIVWGKARSFLPLSLVKSVLSMMLPELAEKTRVRSFFEAEVAVADSQYEQALNKYREALTHTENSQFLNEAELTVVQFPLLRMLGRNDELKALIKAQLDKEHVSPIIWVSAASNLREIGNRDAAVAMIQKGIKEPNLSEQEVILSAEIIGSEIVTIVDELAAQAKAMPYSWKVRVAALMAKGISTHDSKATQLAFQEASKYCDDELEIISLTYRIQASVMEDAIKYRQVPPESFAEVSDLFRILYVNSVDRIGIDSEKWYQLGELGLACSQGPETLRLFKKYLKDFNASAEMGSEFYFMLFQLAVSVEDDSVVAFAANHPLLAEPDRTDIKVLYAAYLVMKGDYESAKTMLKKGGNLSDANIIVKQSLEAILKARSGEQKELFDFLDRKFDETEANLIARGIAAIALSDLGKNDEAFPHLEALSKYNLTMLGALPTRCLERYLKLLKQKGEVVKADEMFFRYVITNQLAPGVMNSYFGLKPGIDGYAVQIKADTKWVSEELFDESNPAHKQEYIVCAIGEGHIEITISTDGRLSGFIQVKDGERFEVSGKVDEFGNLRGEAKSSRHQNRIEAKLIGKEFQKTETFRASNIGQLIKIYDEKGLLTQWMLPYSVLKPAGG